MRKSASDRAFDFVNMFFLLLIVVACLYPFYYMLIYSFSQPYLAIKGITLWPRGFTLSNYQKVLTLPNIGSALFISISRTVVGTVGTLLCCSFFAYLVTKPLYFRRTIYRMLVITMYIDGGLIPTFLVMRIYGLSNTYWIYIIPSLLSAYNVILIKTFMEQLPASMEESAMLDGAGPIRRWWDIVMPLSKPILATITVFAAVAQWSSWFDASIYIINKNLWPLQYILYRYLKEAQEAAKAIEEGVAAGGAQKQDITPETVRMTITAVVTIPVLFVYPFMQKYFMKGMILGAVKG